jgi:hypothetical protein
MSQSANPFRTCLFGAVIVAGVAASTAPRTADADIYMSTSAGGSCHPAFGASTSFRFTSTYAENIGTTDQYLVCSFTNWDVGSAQLGRPIVELRVFFSAGAYAGTISCATQMGSYYAGATHFNSSLTKSTALGAGTSSDLIWSGTDLPRTEEYATLVMNCKLPRGFRLGLLQRFEPEPASGEGWTP